MSLFCLKCGVYSYRNKHKCNIMDLIPLSPPCKGLALKLHNLGLDLLSAGCFSNLVEDSSLQHHITFDLEFRKQYPPDIFVLPDGWNWYTEVVGTSIQLSAIGYSETFVWSNEVTVQERIKQIAQGFERFLDEVDGTVLKAVLTLYDA